MNTTQFLHAVDAYERLAGLRVCYHDYTNGDIAAVLGVERRNHVGKFCTLVKKRNLTLCTGCDIGMVRGRMGARTDTFVKVCHAAAIEVVIPVAGERGPAGALFVGPFVFGGSGELLPGSVQQRSPRTALSAAAIRERAALPRLSKARVDDIADLGRALADGLPQAISRDAGPAAGRRGYRERVQQFVRGRAGEPVRLGDLAARLMLSESRTSRVVRNHFGMTFSKLLAEQRLQMARQLLQDSYLTVTAIAQLVGIPDANYFHRLFRTATGITPLEYRAKHAGSAASMDV